MVLWPESRIKAPHFSNSHRAQTSWISEQRYELMALESQNTVVAVHTYKSKGGSYCKAFTDRTITVLDILTTGKMADKMVVVSSQKMASAISQDGKIALYGIRFDTGKAELKPESHPTIVQIAKLLKADPGMHLLVVGYTDTKGSFQSNKDLSQRRADQVVAELKENFGIDSSRLFPVGVSFASPVATNETEQGRAENRRVELVRF
ncbi:MAG: OmpA family protein [Desulfobacter sp.]|nr:MAG: OmpA family protein [Desulfobacter sp.]